MKTMYTDSQGRVTGTIPELDTGVRVLALDGSTSRSGICVMSASGKLDFVGAVIRGAESVVEYKLGLKWVLSEVIKCCTIRHAAYEEPFIGYANDAKGLYMIASSLDEVVAEESLPVMVVGVNNKRWKSQFLQTKLHGGRDVQKKLVYEKAVSLAPGLAACKDDETDAFGLAYYLSRCVREGMLHSMSSKGKPPKFGYDLRLFGGRLTSEEVMGFIGTQRVKDGFLQRDISAKRSFSGAVYELMQGKDAMLVLHFKSGKFGNIVLEHGAGELAAFNEYLTAVVTRKSKRRRGISTDAGNDG